MRFRRHRYPTRFPITLTWAAGQSKCAVANINETGAKLTKIDGLRRGDKVTIHLSMGRACGVVQWVTNDHVGIAFQPHIPLNFVDAMRQGGGRAKTGPSSFGHGLREMR